MNTNGKFGKRPWWIAAALLVAMSTPVLAQGKPTEANMAQLDISDGRVRFDVRGIIGYGRIIARPLPGYRSNRHVQRHGSDRKTTEMRSTRNRQKP